MQAADNLSQRIPLAELGDAFRRCARLHQLAKRTEQAYLDWFRRYVVFHRNRHPDELGAHEVAAFLTHLAADRQVAKATQDQALNALVFVYRHFLERPLPDDSVQAVRSQRGPRISVVLTAAEVSAILGRLVGANRLVAELLYGSGLRLLEALRLRVKDVDAARLSLTVRASPDPS